MRLVVVETGTANVGSGVNMFRRLGGDPVASGDPGMIQKADKLLLPGVGAFDAGMASLHGSSLVEVLRIRASEGVPILGICLGMQLLFDSSEEGSDEGLGLIPGVVRRLSPDSSEGPVKIPHMGWSRIEKRRPTASPKGLGRRHASTSSIPTLSSPKTTAISSEFPRTVPSLCRLSHARTS